MDLVGGYEQVDPSRQVHQCLEQLEAWVRRTIAVSSQSVQSHIQLLQLLHTQGTHYGDNFVSLLQECVHDDAEASALASNLYAVLESSKQQMDGARFQWVDGILIRALEQGLYSTMQTSALVLCLIG
jgi:midasin